MFRKILSVAAGMAMLAGSALAVDVSGTYAGQPNGMQVAIQLQQSGSSVTGVVRIGPGYLPMTGQIENGQVHGVLQGANGQRFPFAAQLNNGHLDVVANGALFSLDNAGGQAQAPQQQPVVQEQDQPAPAQQQPAGQFGAGPTTVRMEQGQIFARPVPAGWQSTESCNETFIVAPDQSMAIGFTGFEDLRPTTPAQFMQWMIVDVYKHDNFKILSQKEVPTNDGTATVEALVSFTTQGHPCKSWVRCAVLTAYGSSNGYMLFASAVPEKFDAVAPSLKQMAEKIQITDVNAVFDRARRLGVIRSIKNNPIPDTIIVGYNERQHIMDNVSARRGDVATDQYHLTSDSGREYYMGQSAYDPTIGGFRDPKNSTRVLQMDPHWQGH